MIILTPAGLAGVMIIVFRQDAEKGEAGAHGDKAVPRFEMFVASWILSVGSLKGEVPGRLRAGRGAVSYWDDARAKEESGF